jgi:hypothetical protein
MIEASKILSRPEVANAFRALVASEMQRANIKMGVAAQVAAGLSDRLLAGENVPTATEVVEQIRAVVSAAGVTGHESQQCNVRIGNEDSGVRRCSKALGHEFDHDFVPEKPLRWRIVRADGTKTEVDQLGDSFTTRLDAIGFMFAPSGPRLYTCHAMLNLSRTVPESEAIEVDGWKVEPIP